jgi:hypothetical protein
MGVLWRVYEVDDEEEVVVVEEEILVGESMRFVAGLLRAVSRTVSKSPSRVGRW